MLRLACSPILLALLATAVPAQAPAATAAELHEGRTLRTSDGKRIGQIDRISRDQSGNPVAASVIYNGRFVSVPAATISGNGSAYVTSLTLSDVRKLH